jgi:hypothetical protein
MKSPDALPYHLRAPRLRWAALAVDLSPEEVTSLKLLAAETHYSPRERMHARLLLGLHFRVPIHDLCERLAIDRRTLFRLGNELIEKRNQRRSSPHSVAA